MRRELSPEAKRILSIVREREMDGFSLMSASGYDLEAIAKAVEELLAEELIAVKGATHGRALGEAWIYVPLDTKGLADQVLRRSSLR